VSSLVNALFVRVRLPPPLGTDEPIQHDGSLFKATGATVNTDKGLRVDPALLAATAPLFNLINNGATQTVFTSATDFMEVSAMSQVTSTTPLATLDNSMLTVTLGDFLTIAGGARLDITGGAAFLTLANGSTLTIANGLLIDATGANTVVNITGLLANFVGAGNQITVTNNIAPTDNSFKGTGIPVNVGGGGSLTLTNNAFTNDDTKITVNGGGSLIRVQNGASVTIAGEL